MSLTFCVFFLSSYKAELSTSQVFERYRNKTWKKASSFYLGLRLQFVSEILNMRKPQCLEKRVTWFEHAAFSLATRCSTTELYPLLSVHYNFNLKALHTCSGKYKAKLCKRWSITWFWVINHLCFLTFLPCSEANFLLFLFSVKQNIAVHTEGEAVELWSLSLFRYTKVRPYKAPLCKCFRKKTQKVKLASFVEDITFLRQKTLWCVL